MTHPLKTAQAALHQRRKLLKTAISLPLAAHLPASFAQSSGWRRH